MAAFLAGRVHLEEQLNGGGWGDFNTGHIDAGVISAITSEEAFSSLGGAVAPALTLPAEVANPGGGDTYEMRFTLQQPLALQVVYRVDVDSGSGYVQGSEQTLNVSPGTPQTITVTTTITDAAKLNLLSLRWHPWAA